MHLHWGDMSGKSRFIVGFPWKGNINQISKYYPLISISPFQKPGKRCRTWWCHWQLQANHCVANPEEQCLKCSWPQHEKTCDGNQTDAQIFCDLGKGHDDGLLITHIHHFHRLDPLLTQHLFGFIDLFPKFIHLGVWTTILFIPSIKILFQCS